MTSRLRILAASSLTLLVLAAGVPAARAASSPSLSRNAWIPYWNEDAGIKEARAHLEDLDSVSAFALEVQPDGTIRDRLGLGSSPWRSFLRDADKEGTDVFLTVSWMSGADIHATLSDRKKRDRHIKDLVSLATKHKSVDGIEIDYEGKLAETNPYFSTFLKELGRKLDAKRKNLACDIEARTPRTDLYGPSAPPATAYANDYAAIGTACDQVRIMAYDQGRAVSSLNALAGSSLYAPVSDVAWVRKVMSSTTPEIAPRKVVMGIPTYGRVYRLDPGGAYTQISSITYADAVALAKRQGAAPARGGGGELTFSYFGLMSGLPGNATPTGLMNRYFVTVSDGPSIASHVALAKELGLGGVALFKLDGATDPAAWPGFLR